MSGFIAWLENSNERDAKVRAVLRRSLAFEAGAYIPAYPYIERFLTGAVDDQRRQMHYLVAGLWAAHWREGRTGPTTSIATACARHLLKSQSSSTERRFIHLLDADLDQLPHRLRQMIALLHEEPLDFETLLNDLLCWNRTDKRVQNAWARAFYRVVNHSKTGETQTEIIA